MADRFADLHVHLRKPKCMKIVCLNLICFLLLPATAFLQGVKISNNGTQPDASAQLQVESTNKGVLIPQVDLQSSSDAGTIPSPASSLMVYNIGVTLSPAGYYYNAGTAQAPHWIAIFTNPASDTLDMGVNPVVNVPLPLNPNDAVNKDYVDNAILANGGGASFPTEISPESSVGMNLGDAGRYCRNLNYNGHTDWYLPTYSELLYCFSKGGIVVVNDASANYLWTTTPSNTSTTYITCFRFSDGTTVQASYTGSSTTPYARCVR